MVIKKTSILLIIILSLISCASDDTENIEIPFIEIDTSNIQLQINSQGLTETLVDERFVLSQDELLISLSNEANIASIGVYMDNQLVATLLPQSLIYVFNVDSFSDGDHILRVDVLTDADAMASKSVSVKIDNTAPSFDLNGISDNETICKEITISPQITDLVSGINSVKIYLNNELIQEFVGNTDYSFVLVPNNYSTGSKVLKFVYTDNVGNSEDESINVELLKKITNINIPENFTRDGIDQFYVILSDNDGNYIEHWLHSNTEETIELCSSINISDSDEFTLTFVEKYENFIYNFFVYSNLSINALSGDIEFKQRLLNTAGTSVNLSVPFYQNGYELRAVGSGYSIPYINNMLSGHFNTSDLANLGTDKAFVQYYNENLNIYQWAFLDNITEINSLSASDLNSDNVTSWMQIQGTNSTASLRLFGFENQEHYNKMIQHNVYTNFSVEPVNGYYNYSFANIFDNMMYSTQIDNYSVQEVGIPNILTKPNESISCSVSGNTISYSGLSNYEVGRVRLENNDSEHISVEFVFNGQASQVKIPEMPAGLFSQNVTNAFNNNNLEMIQAVAENYNTFNSYDDYIENVLITSDPFYISATKRERIFTSSVSSQLLPIWEFPYYTRF